MDHLLSAFYEPRIVLCAFGECGAFLTCRAGTHTLNQANISVRGAQSLSVAHSRPKVLFVQWRLKEELGLQVKDKQGLFGFGFGLFAFVSFCLLT